EQTDGKQTDDKQTDESEQGEQKKQNDEGEQNNEREGNNEGKQRLGSRFQIIFMAYIDKQLSSYYSYFLKGSIETNSLSTIENPININSQRSSKVELMTRLTENFEESLENDWQIISQALHNPSTENCSILVNVQNNGINFNLMYDYIAMKFDQKLFELRDSDDIKIIKREFSSWIRRNSVMDFLDTELNIYKLRHFLQLYNGYAALFEFVRKNTPDEFESLSLDQKIEQGIPLRLETTKAESRIWTALCRIKFILENGIKSIRELAQADAICRFIENIFKENFSSFLYDISEGKFKEFSVSEEFDKISSIDYKFFKVHNFSSFLIRYILWIINVKPFLS
ncbi:10669_t:CDS:2, partial [Dentiscutata erythropus]